MTKPPPQPTIRFVACIGNSHVPVADLLFHLAGGNTIGSFAEKYHLSAETCREVMHVLASWLNYAEGGDA